MSSDKIIKDDNDSKDDKSDKSDKSKKKSIKEKESKKAVFLQRFIAICIDMVIVSIFVTLFSMPFVDREEMNKLNIETNDIVEKYTNNEIDFETYSNEAMTVSYQLAKTNGIVSLITIVFSVLYFVVYQFYKGGQTIGKKIMKIRVESISGELTMNQMIFRTLIINSILLDLICFSFMVFSSKEVYFYGVAIFEMIQYIVIIASVFMIMYGKSARGVHDLVARTNVVKI